LTKGTHIEAVIYSNYTISKLKCLREDKSTWISSGAGLIV
jgi:hypothetical protein